MNDMEQASEMEENEKITIFLKKINPKVGERAGNARESNEQHDDR